MSDKTQFSFERIYEQSSDLLLLFHKSDEYVTSLYPSESNHLVSYEEIVKNKGEIVGIYSGRYLIGCGAIVFHETTKNYAEVKRVYILEGYRGLGLSRKLVEELERIASEWHVNVIRLETGVKQLEAIGLYRKMGFSEIEAFGEYTPDPLSIYMEKEI